MEFNFRSIGIPVVTAYLTKYKKKCGILFFLLIYSQWDENDINANWVREGGI
jgi:hypothetical protein